jgi:error-prone DNA polymerase
MRYVPLACHSYYSMMSGTLSPEYLCKMLKSKGHTQFAIADDENFYGLIFLAQTAMEYGLDMAVGATFQSENGENSTLLLVKDREGYANLCQLITLKKSGESFNLISQLQTYHEGLIIISTDREIVQALQGKVHLYGAVGIQNAYADFHWFRQHDILPVVYIPFYFGSPKGHKLHRVLHAIKQNTKLSRVKESNLIPDYFVHSYEDVLNRMPFAEEAIHRSQEIFDLCQWRAVSEGFVFPENAGNSDYQQLKNSVYAGAQKRYGEVTREVRDRIEHELKTIKQKRFANYFLIVQDIVKECPITCGRGSAAASIVSYALNITHVDPLKHNLFFERFLSPGRKDPPDIDVDFPWDMRDGVLDYVFETYGQKHSAMVCNHVTFKARSSIREVAKVYGLPEGEINVVTKRLGGLWYVSDPFKELETNPLLSDLDLRPPWPEIIQTGFLLAGFPHYLSVHPGGVIITPDALNRYVPTEQARKGVKIIQWEKDQSEDFGLVKIDILGNRSLAVIRDALASIKAHYGVDIPYWKLNPLNDFRTQELVRTGGTMGCFYVESPATRQLLTKMKTGLYEHLVIASSIIRPAANRWNREFVRRLHGGSYDPLHPLLEETLKETFGIMAYQEDVTKVAMALAGFTVDEGDALRKIMSKKHKTAKLRDFQKRFYDGATERGISQNVIDTIWDMILSFSGYSFPKAHSASYALVSFKSAYIKAHYPAEFIAAVISNQGGYYGAFGYISEGRRMGLTILLPDINASEIHYTGVNNELRIGFMQIKGIQHKTLEKIIQYRESSGRFSSIEDFFLRAKDVELGDIKLLIKSGCFDSISHGKTRPQLMWQAIQAKAMHYSTTQKTLLENDEYYLPETEEYTLKTMYFHEIDILGYLVSRHPLSLYQHILATIPYVKAVDMHRYVGREINLIGWLITSKVVHTKDSEPMDFVSFEDTTAIYETVFFPESYRLFCRMLSKVRPYLIHGTVEEDYGALSFTVKRIDYLDKLMSSNQKSRRAS